MPKIVDHKKYRAEIVVKAAPIFSELGYTGLGMRQIADYLKMSKSALYHYFSSKEELFAACTEFVVGRDVDTATASTVPETPEEKSKELMLLVLEIEKNFQGEMYLLMDYIRGKSSREVSRDANMRHANERYLSMIAHHVGEDAAPQIFTLMLGGLVQRLLDGKKTSMADIEGWVLSVLKTHS